MALILVTRNSPQCWCVDSLLWKDVRTLICHSISLKSLLLLLPQGSFGPELPGTVSCNNTEQMLARSLLHVAAIIYLKSQIHLNNLVDTKRGFFSLRLWEVNGKEFHLLHYLQNYLGSSRLKDSPHTQELILHICSPSLPHPSLRVKLMNPERDPSN